MPHSFLTPINVVFTVTIAVGVQGKPSPPTKDFDGPLVSNYQLFKSPSFTDALGAITTLIFAYAGTPTFFSIASEMRDPRQYTKALMVCQGGITGAYIIVGVVVYYFCGSYVASPALGSAGPLIKKVAYGIGLPGLLVTDLLLIHVSLRFPAQHSKCKHQTNLLLDCRQNHLCPSPPQLKAFDVQYHEALGRLARLNLHHRHCGIHCCQRHSHLWTAHCTDWSTSRPNLVLLPSWSLLGVRQLEASRRPEENRKMVRWSRCQCLCDYHWNVFDGCRYL